MKNLKQTIDFTHSVVNVVSYTIVSITVLHIHNRILNMFRAVVVSKEIYTYIKLAALTGTVKSTSLYNRII